MESNIKQIMDHATEHADSLIRSGIDRFLSMLFYKNVTESYVSFEERWKIIEAIFSYMDDVYDGEYTADFGDRHEVECMVNDIRERIGLPRRQ